MVSQHTAFFAIVSIFMVITFLFIRHNTDAAIGVFQWGVFLIMSSVGGVIGGLFAYDD